MADQIKKHVLSIVDDLNNGCEEWRNGETEDGEQFSAFDYLQDVLDINWVLNSDKTFKGARLLVAFGGPNIWIDTNTGKVEGYWWGDNFVAKYNSNSEFALELDEALETLYNC